MVTKHVIVLPYDEKWEENFLAIKYELLNALGGLAKKTEHIGSTFV
ncbi:MAG: hypothetical protein ACFWTJ_15265 [Lachnoclostridium sp.]|jgi:GrpB-like predicted nucleotidyltransferase (UPF0157 family)